MSPEQLRGDDLDPRTDLYSLGVLLYEACTGRRPHEADQVPGLISAILTMPPIPPRQRRPELSPGVERIILRCLERDRARRYASARELAADLGKLLHAPAGAKSFLPRRSGRFRWIVPVILVLGIAAALVLYIGRLRTLATDGGLGGMRASILVLPVANLTGTPDDEFLADGITDDVITRLSQTRGTKVISRTSAMALKGTPRRLADLARELRVNLVVEEALQRAGGRLRVTAKLLDARTEANLWSDSFERDRTDLDEISASVASAIVERLKIPLTASERDRVTRAPHVDPSAHESYLKGRYFLSRYGTDEVGRRPSA